jgi:hypothetical protein
VLLDERAHHGQRQTINVRDAMNLSRRREDHEAPTVFRGLRDFVMVCILLVSTPLSAQWLKYPTPGVPKSSNGSPNLRAPTPRTPDGRPDLSGIWEPEQTRPCPPAGCADMPVGEQFINLGWGLPGGLPYQPWAAELVKRRQADDGKDDPISQCLPIGVPRIHTLPLPRKIVHIPGLIVVLSEQNVSYRQIFTDGRPLPVDPQPSWNGYSVGTWDGDVLVVQTSGLRDEMWLDRAGSPMTDAARVTERFHRADFGTLEIEITVDDPKAYARPWTTKLRHFLLLDTDLLDYVCLENERDVEHLNVSGKSGEVGKWKVEK